MKIETTKQKPPFTPFDLNVTIETRAEQRVLQRALLHFLSRHARLEGDETIKALADLARAVEEGA